MEQIKHLIDMIPGKESGLIGALAIILEMGMRLFPSAKPLSIAYMIEDGIKLIGSGFGKIGDLLEKVLPQRLK